MVLKQPTIGRQSPAKAKTIVIVEDEMIAAADVRQRLESWGYHVGAVVASGEEAIATAESTRPDLMLMDIKLKGTMDGVEAARRIRARTDIPVIYATAHADPATMQRAQVTEPFGLINKPYDDTQMRSAIAMTLFKRSMERQIDEVDDRYRRLMARTSDLVFVVRDRRIVAVSASVMSVLGYSPDELVGKEITRFITEEHVGLVRSLTAESAGKAAPSSSPVIHVRTRTDAAVTVELSVTPTRQNGERVFLLTMKDVTERELARRETARLAEELFEARSEAEEALRLVRFKHQEIAQLREDLDTEKASHAASAERWEQAVKVPLGTLNDLTGSLLDAGLTPAQRRAVEEMRDALRTLSAMGVAAAMAQVTAPAGCNIRSRDTDVRQSVLSLMDRFARMAREKGIILSTRVDTDVPPILHLDADRWMEVLTELIGNALRFTHQGEVALTVHAERGESGSVTLRADVADTGEGIPAAIMPRLFERRPADGQVVVRADAPRGTSLPFCRQVVERMGGTISVESEPGRGSMFRCRIPCTVPLREEKPGNLRMPRPPVRIPEEIVHPVNDPPAVTGVHRGPRVLVTDDEEINRAIARRMLENLGCSVDVARDGFEAVEAVRAVPYDMLFLDCRMPGLDGFAVAAAIRAMPGPPSGLRIIAMSGDMMESDQRRYIASGMDDTVEKPLLMERLRSVLDRWQP